VKKLVSLGGVAGLAVVALLSTRGQAADRASAPTPGPNPMADISDVYAWMTGSNLNLVMDVSPLDDGSHGFDPAVQYVFHLTSKAGLGVGAAGGTETRVILRFTSNTSVECWVTDADGITTKDYVSGDPSGAAGIASVDRKVKVFAGRRSDPAFFNTAGFAAAAARLGMNVTNTAVPKDVAGCPAIGNPEALTIQNLLTTGSDTFAAANVMAIVVAVDKSLVNVVPGTGVPNTTVAIWGSTHAGS
jgi:hypothetical protein